MERLQHPEARGSAITKAQLLTWLNMSPEEHSKAGGWITWAQAQGIATNNARMYLSNTGLTARGMERIQRPEERGFPITDRQIQTWRELPQATKREAGGWAKWVQARGISIASAKKYLTNTGLTPRGMELLRSPEDKGAPISDSQLLTWLNMSPEEHSEAGGWKVWVQTQGIAINSARKHLTNVGLTPLAWNDCSTPKREVSPSRTDRFRHGETCRRRRNVRSAAGKHGRRHRESPSTAPDTF